MSCAMSIKRFRFFYQTYQHSGLVIYCHTQGYTWAWAWELPCHWIPSVIRHSLCCQQHLHGYSYVRIRTCTSSRWKQRFCFQMQALRCLGYNWSLESFPLKFGHYLYSPRASDPNPHKLIGLFYFPTDVLGIWSTDTKVAAHGEWLQLDRYSWLIQRFQDIITISCNILHLCWFSTAFYFKWL